MKENELKQTLTMQLEKSKMAIKKSCEMFDILNPVCPHCREKHYIGLQFACKNGYLKGVGNE